MFNYYVNLYLTQINPFNKLFVSNIDGLIIIYIILNYQINKRVIRVTSFYLIINWVGRV